MYQKKKKKQKKREKREKKKDISCGGNGLYIKQRIPFLMSEKSLSVGFRLRFFFLLTDCISFLCDKQINSVLASGPICFLTVIPHS